MQTLDIYDISLYPNQFIELLLVRRKYESLATIIVLLSVQDYVLRPIKTIGVSLFMIKSGLLRQNLSECKMQNNL